MSEVIITAEMKEDAKKCDERQCFGCKMPTEFHGRKEKCVEALLKELLKEYNERQGK